MKQFKNTFLFIFIAFFVSNCSEKGMTLEQKDAYLKKHVNKNNKKEAKELKITLKELEELKQEASQSNINFYYYKEFRKNLADGSNITIDYYKKAKEKSKKLGLTLYQYQDKIEAEGRDKLLIQTLNNLKKDNSKSHSNKSPKDSIKEEYTKLIKPIYTFKKSNITNHDSFALVIGINDYKQNTSVEFADLSALAFQDLATQTFGVPKENVITLLNDEATSGQLKSKIELIKELADSNGNLYIYFAGHGVPGKDGNTYILPNDMSADSIHLEPNLQLNKIYSKLSKSNAKNVFVFMDSCFSGKDDKGELLYKGVAPILKRNKENSINQKLTILTAGGANDFANDYKEQNQRLFSHYLIKELAQGEINLEKVYATIKNKVKRTSLMKGIGYKQVPEIHGNKQNFLY